MLDSCRTKVSQVNHSGVVAISLRISIMIMILGFFGVSPAFGDSQYSDTWFDDSQAEEGIGNAVGSGVVDGTYTHYYYIDTTIKSPSLRTGVDSSEQTVGYARVDVPLQWLAGDSGDYITQSKHWSHCPDSMFFAANGLTVDDIFLNDGDIQTLDYVTDGPLSSSSCGYQLCPYEEEKPCWSRFRNRQTYEKNDDQDKPCWPYLRAYYVVVTTPISYHCVRAYRSPYYNLPGNACAY